MEDSNVALGVISFLSSQKEEDIWGSLCKDFLGPDFE
jgi:hypothetical protein